MVLSRSLVADLASSAVPIKLERKMQAVSKSSSFYQEQRKRRSRRRVEMLVASKSLPMSTERRFTEDDSAFNTLYNREFGNVSKMPCIHDPIPILIDESKQTSFQRRPSP